MLSSCLSITKSLYIRCYLLLPQARKLSILIILWSGNWSSRKTSYLSLITQPVSEFCACNCPVVPPSPSPPPSSCILYHIWVKIRPTYVLFLTLLIKPLTLLCGIIFWQSKWKGVYSYIFVDKNFNVIVTL